MTDASRSPWPRRFGLAGIASALIAAVGAYGSGFGFWHFTIGFLMIGVALLIALVALIAGVVLLLRGRRGTMLGVGMLCALGLTSVIGLQIWRGSQVPPIHDISTDLTNPPQFEHITPRADLYAGLDGGIEEWRRLHREAYGDIEPIIESHPQPYMSLNRVRELVEARGWTIVRADSRIEATDTVSPFKFKDDIVIVWSSRGDPRCPTCGLGPFYRIDIRSVSRVGISDLGVNARRVRALIADIRAMED